MDTIETLHSGWRDTMFTNLYRWHEDNGVFQYALEVDENAETYTIVVERVDAFGAKRYGPYKNHYNATAAVIAHSKGGKA